LTLPSWPADRPLRAWQQAAAAAVFSHPGDAFLASATPAAGKTTFGLHVAHRMLSEGRVARVAVVAPTTHIARQWAADAAPATASTSSRTARTPTARSRATATASP
jgi:superfamily II DNA or RNA helicase